jgi:diadenosine tetraphosphate (Ap4A) HIT family hydrolase
MQKLTTYDGLEYDVDCIGCAINQRVIKMDHSLVYEDEHFIIAQDTENPITGFFVIGSRRHFKGFNEMNNEEKQKFYKLFLEMRRILGETFGVENVTVIQEDGSEGAHFHLWFFPWLSWMADMGESLGDIRKIMEFSRTNMRSTENLKEIKESIAKAREAFSL